MALDSNDFVRAINQALDKRVPTVMAVSKRTAFPLQQCHAIDYIQPRIALIADAAHSIHPLAGQGINLGLKDIAVLCTEISEARTRNFDHGSDAVLYRYQRQRKGENLAMTAAMEAFKYSFGSPNPALRLARNAGLSWVDKFTPLKRWLADHAIT